MFAKLLKHEIKATGGMLGLLSLAALAVGVVGGFLLRYNMNASANAETAEVLSVVSAVALPLIFLSLVAYALGSEIYLAVQFYKRKFTDQGYLTFTLPVRGWQIYLSSLLNIILWTVVISVVSCIAFACIFCIGVLGTEVWNRLMELPLDIEREFQYAYSELGISPLYMVVEFLCSNVMLVTSITLGSVLAKKRKVLGAIATYYCATMLIGAVNSWISGMMLNTANPQLDVFFNTSTVISCVVMVLASMLSIWLMDKKLNLP